MHICFISHEYPQKDIPHGGIGTFLQTIATSLVEAGHEVTVIGWYKGSKLLREVDHGVSIIRTPYPNITGLKWLQNIWNISSEVKKIHEHKKIDIIEGQEGAFAFFPKIRDIKYIIRLHGGHHFFSTYEQRGINPWKGFLEKKSFKKADGFISVSKHVQEVTQKYISFKGKPERLINYPINTTRFYKADAKKSQRYKIVFAGTICEKKGVRQLLKAVHLLLDEYPNLKVELYGRDWFYPNGQSYIEEMKAQDFFNTDAMHFMGPLPHEELPVKYEEADICVFPSHGETQGLVAPEAMCMGKIVLFSEIGPGPETIIDGETGFLCNPHDAQDIANKLRHYFINRSVYSEMGNMARLASLKKFDPNIIMSRNLAFYSELINLKIDA